MKKGIGIFFIFVLVLGFMILNFDFISSAPPCGCDGAGNIEYDNCGSCSSAVCSGFTCSCVPNNPDASQSICLSACTTDRTPGDLGKFYGSTLFDDSTNFGNANCCGDDSYEYYFGGDACCGGLSDCGRK